MTLKIENFLKIFCLVAICIYTLFWFFIPIETEDGWWHLATGKWIVEHHQVPHDNVFSFTEKKQPWIFTQWLGSTILYLSYAAGGELGVKLFRDFVFAVIIAVFYFYARKRIPTVLLVVLLFLMIQGLGGRSLLRPLIFNFIFIQLMLQILFQYLDQRDWKKLIPIPLLGALWSNIHLGSFVYGFLIIGIFWFSTCVDWMNAKFAKNDRLKHLTMLIICYAFSFLVSPYGLEGALYPYKVFLLPKFINFYKYNALIQEMLPPVYILSWGGSWFWILSGLVGMSIWSAPKNKFLLTMLFVVPLFMFLNMARGQEIFVLASLYVIVEGLKNPGNHKLLRFQIISPTFIYSILILLMASQTIQIFNKSIVKDGVQKKFWTENLHVYNPKKTFDFIKINNIRGNLFSSDVIGGYVLWSSYPDLKPFVDGRQIDQELYATYVMTKTEPEKYWPIVDKQYDFQVVVMDASIQTSYKMLEYLAKQSDWQLVFINGVYVTFVKRGIFALPKDINDFENKLKNVSLNAEDIAQLKASQINVSRSFLSYLLHPPLAYIESLEEGTTLIGMGYEGEGVKRILESLRLNYNEVARNAVPFILKYLETKH